MVVGSVVIIFAATKILSSIGHAFMPGQQSSSNSRYAKRGLDEQNDQVFLPMIPGVTLPMSHIGYYLLALAICGSFHEAGHAIASFSEGVPIQSAGMFILYLYPGAFVNIPDQLLQNLEPLRQLRIMCAGVWHNLILYLFSYISLSGGLKLLLLLMGWQSLEGDHRGVSVVHVRESSPLAMHLPASSIIYQLDDFALNNNIIDWNSYLLDEDGQHTIDTGFCVPSNYEYAMRDCCEITQDFPFGQSENASISCFSHFPISFDEKRICLPTLKVLTLQEEWDVGRCKRTEDCHRQEDMCVVPYTPMATGQVVRIYVRYPSWIGNEDEREQVFVFEGELVDIWESVKVSILTPRYWFLPSSLPHILELLLRYISSFTLALALLNILPAFKLDGEFALEQLLTMILQPKDSSTMTTRSVETHRFTRKLHAMIVKVASFIVGFVIIGSIFVGLLL
ncbi:peptidase M50 [Backusella circina FSU 941]|nr:peptidase M50 [Backusella circina FSU 941]